MADQVPQFVVFQDRKGSFEWALIGHDRTVAVSGEAYPTHEACLESIRLLVELAPKTGINDKVDNRWHKKP
jgi:uncharacterized protein YegP (UPF0339 family)